MFLFVVDHLFPWRLIGVRVCVCVYWSRVSRRWTTSETATNRRPSKRIYIWIWARAVGRENRRLQCINNSVALVLRSCTIYTRWQSTELSGIKRASGSSQTSHYIDRNHSISPVVLPESNCLYCRCWTMPTYIKRWPVGFVYPSQKKYMYVYLCLTFGLACFFEFKLTIRLQCFYIHVLVDGAQVLYIDRRRVRDAAAATGGGVGLSPCWRWIMQTPGYGSAPASFRQTRRPRARVHRSPRAHG